MEKNPQLLLLIGAPGSGKSTFAKYFIRTEENWMRLCRDDFRNMNFSDSLLSKEKENLITEMQDMAIEALLRKNCNVLLDATHCRAEYLNHYIEKFNSLADISFKLFECETDELIARCEKRHAETGVYVPSNVIKRFAGELETLKKTFNFSPRPLRQTSRATCQQVIETVKNYIRSQGLLNPGDKIIVGLSGGADSVVLLSILHKLGYECFAAHCNFHLRGDESFRDEQWASRFADSLRVPVYTQDFDTYSIVKERSISIEMAARDLRYTWFETLRNELQANVIAVAHHNGDSVETMLLNLIRGTGIAGLTGIKPKAGRVIRPLLCISKEAILQYAGSEKLFFVTDSSNLQEEFTRNKIRHRVLPLLQSLNPSLDVSLLRTMEHLSEVEKIYRSHVAEAQATVFNSSARTIDIQALLACPSPESILFEILKEYGFKKEIIRNIFQAIEGQPGKAFYSPKYKLIKDRKHFFLFPLEQKQENPVFYIEQNEREITFPFPMRMSVQQAKTEIINDKKIACLDFKKLKFPLILRKWQKGDRFVPLGMNGSQKLSDFFNNQKLNRQEKENTWILCSENEIVWIIGFRISHRFRIERSTNEYYILKLL
jgi:tRNA(Ile)-lysidine synthase